jgi:hypothetical protein
MPAGPFGGEKFTVPEKPLTLDTVIVVELRRSKCTSQAQHSPA